MLLLKLKVTHLNFCHITQTPNREAVKFAIESISYGTPNAGFSHTWRPCQTDDLACQKQPSTLLSLQK
jgi:hypothetical protein